MRPPVPYVQLMADALLRKKGAEVMIVVEERVGIADDQHDLKLAQMLQLP